MLEGKYFVEFVKRRQKELHLSDLALAKLCGLGNDAIRNILSGRSKNPRLDTYNAIMKVIASDTVPVIGAVHLGGKVSLQEDTKKIRRVPMPSGVEYSEGIECYEVADDCPSLALYKGWLLFVNSLQPENISDAIISKALHIAMLPNNERVVALIRPGNNGKYRLNGYFAADDIEAEIVSCYKVVSQSMA